MADKIGNYLGKYAQIDHYTFLVWRYQVLIGAIIFLFGTAFGMAIAIFLNWGKVLWIRPFM